MQQIIVNESKVKFKGKSTLKQYNSMLPIKSDIKIYLCKENSINSEFDQVK